MILTMTTQQYDSWTEEREAGKLEFRIVGDGESYWLELRKIENEEGEAVEEEWEEYDIDDFGADVLNRLAARIWS